MERVDRVIVKRPRVAYRDSPRVGPNSRARRVGELRTEAGFVVLDHRSHSELLIFVDVVIERGPVLV